MYRKPTQKQRELRDRKLDAMRRGKERARPSPWGSNDIMTIAAVRYCLGRQSYIVGDCVSWLRANWLQFDKSAKNIIQRDIDEAFKQDDDAREEGREYKPLGWDCDRSEWEKARKLWKL